MGSLNIFSKLLIDNKRESILFKKIEVKKNILNLTSDSWIKIKSIKKKNTESGGTLKCVNQKLNVMIKKLGTLGKAEDHVYQNQMVN